MANYSLVINSKFRPFEFDEMLKPVMIAEQAHREVEDAYSDLMTKTNIWDKLTNAETDKRAHGIYSSYARALEQEADRLARQGLSPTSRQSMINMKSRYSRDIVPIENAYKRKQAQMEEQRKALLANPTLLLSRRASTTSLDDYLDNPNLDYENYSGALLTSQVSAQAANLAKELTSYGNGKPLDRFTNTFLKQHGFTRDQVLRAINNPDDPTSSPVLNAIVKSTINSSGILDWADDETVRRGYNYARQGLWSAIGQSDVTTYENKGAVLAQQLANSKELARYQHELVTNQQNQDNQDKLKMYDVSPTPYFSKDEVTRANNAVAIELDKWKDKGYFTSSGKLSTKGLEALRNAGGQKSQYVGTSPSGIAMYRPSTETGDLNFLAWAQRNGVTGKDDPHAVSKLNKYYGDTRAAIASGELATGVANFQAYRQRLGDKTTRNIVADNLLNIIGDGVIYEAGQLSNGTITKGASYDVDKFKEAIGYDGQQGMANILYIANAPTVGTAGQQFVELTNGKKFLIPNGEQFFGSDTYHNLVSANTKVRNAGSIAEVATHLNRANSYMAAPLTTVGGTEIKPNDGTVTIDLLDLLDN